MKLLFIADPLDAFKIYKDTTYAMMREAARRGHALSACTPKDMMWSQATGVTAFVRQITLTGDEKHWYTADCEPPNEKPVRVAQFDAVLMRKDPPFDPEYFYATHLLEQAEREGAKVFNSPRALRDHPEKLAIMEFSQWCSPTLVTRDASDVKRFYAEHKDIILKPLDGMGGTGIFRVRQQADGAQDPNLNVVIETLTRHGAETIMAQRFVPEIAQGDKRILLIAGEVMPQCLARIPQGGETRGNLAAGGKGVAQPISKRDREIGEALAPVLWQRGILFAGIDVIGDYLTEINVTSPTGFQEIAQQTGFDAAAKFVDAVQVASKK
jgi:glutathione synthase